MFKYITTIILCLLTLPFITSAQLSVRATPPSFEYQFAQKPAVEVMPNIDIAKLMAEDEEDLKFNNPLRFAFGHAVNFNLKNAGTWEALPNGDRVWRLQIQCPDALSINFLYSDFYLPEGGQLFIYNKDRSQVLGAFTSKNNKETRRFATALIEDEIATLEYFEPASVKGQSSIEIAQVGHGYRPMGGREDTGSDAGPCQVNVNCSPEGDDWQDEKKGVAKIIMDGLYLCSGSLINNTANDCKPYFLTANHCIMGGVMQDAIINPDVSGYVFYWNYEYAGCSASGSLPNQTTNGGTVVANTGPANTGSHLIVGSDFALIQLDESPYGPYNVYFNGFDASGDQGNTGVGIHHPAGDDKKIATHQKTPLDDGYYWEFFWDPTPNGHSVTEGGSSGSPLFRETSRIIGQLYGGSSVNCDDPANDLALYGKMDYSWTNDDHPQSNDTRRRLNDWLDPIGGGTIKVLDGSYNPCQTPKVYFATTETNVNEGASNVSNGCYPYRDYTVTMGITPYPAAPVTATLSAMGSALEGNDQDYTFFPSSVTFNNVTNQKTFTVRVYNDEYVESAEDTKFTFSLSGNAAPLSSNFDHMVNISSDDAAPSSQHVQSVSNDDNPTTHYLGPNGSVYFHDVASGGVMMKIENLSSHDFGCTDVEIDNASASANNNWTTGSTSTKTFRITPEFDNPNATVRVTLYYTNSEVVGYEWFNNEGSDRHDLNVLRFADEAIPANEGSGVAGITTMGSYGNDFTFAADFQGFGGISGGFTVGNLSLNFGGNSQNAFGQNGIQNQVFGLQLSPNPVSDQLNVRFQMENEIDGAIRVVDGFGKVIYQNESQFTKGMNETRLDVSTFGQGIYFIQILGEGGVLEVKRFLKIH